MKNPKFRHIRVKNQYTTGMTADKNAGQKWVKIFTSKYTKCTKIIFQRKSLEGKPVKKYMLLVIIPILMLSYYKISRKYFRPQN